ncbi:MAG: hypothetical protein ISR58_21465 [Anaerolineales bacterium]|nr:hypothetical protein [Chloroflexota bacterium]MBL6983760.1 hypothetical protein [Anaerolineales bacterium]
MYRKLIIVSIATILLAACGSGSAPEKAVENYIQAIIEKDATQLSTITCKDWEFDALMMLDAFQAVSTELEGLSCQETGTTPDGLAVVSCTGKIIASYDGEIQEFDLSIQDYLLENANGEWLVCGMQ